MLQGLDVIFFLRQYNVQFNEALFQRNTTSITQREQFNLNAYEFNSLRVIRIENAII